MALLLVLVILKNYYSETMEMNLKWRIFHEGLWFCLNKNKMNNVQWETKPSTKNGVPTFKSNYRNFNDCFINLKVT